MKEEEKVSNLYEQNVRLRQKYILVDSNFFQTSALCDFQRQLTLP